MENITAIYLGCKMEIRFGREAKLSSEIDQEKGVRQGCSLSPYLFNIFINDILIEVEELNCMSPVMDNKQIPGLLFADDCVLMYLTRGGLQKAIDSVRKFCNKWGLKINVKKTKNSGLEKRGQTQNKLRMVAWKRKNRSGEINNIPRNRHLLKG